MTGVVLKIRINGYEKHNIWYNLDFGERVEFESRKLQLSLLWECRFDKVWNMGTKSTEWYQIWYNLVFDEQTELEFLNFDLRLQFEIRIEVYLEIRTYEYEKY